VEEHVQADAADDGVCVALWSLPMASVSRKRSVRASLETFAKKNSKRRSVWASSMAGMKSSQSDPSLPMELEQGLLDGLQALAGVATAKLTQDSSRG